MIKAINPEATVEYVLEIERKRQDPNPTIWKLGVLDGGIRDFINDRATKFEANSDSGQSADQVFKLGTWRRLIVKYGLRGWSNWADHTGHLLEERFDTVPHFGKSYQVVPDRLLMLMQEEVLLELASEINKLNSFTEEEKRPFG